MLDYLMQTNTTNKKLIFKRYDSRGMTAEVWKESMTGEYDRRGITGEVWQERYDRRGMAGEVWQERNDRREQNVKPEAKAPA